MSIRITVIDMSVDLDNDNLSLDDPNPIQDNPWINFYFPNPKTIYSGNNT
jgi:hypothetical protein